MKPPNKRRDLRIIFGGDAEFSASGYAVELSWLMRRLLKEGFPTAQAAKAGLIGHWIDYNGLRMYPSINDPHGSDSYFYGAQHFNAHVVITMIDVWVLDPNFLQQIKNAGRKLWFYMPIDASPVPPGVLQKLPYADKIITFSKFGQKELARHGFASEMIYEGVDMNELNIRSKEEARKKYGLPQDAFIWGMIAANKENPPRKGFEEALDAFKMFYDKHPEAALMVHTQQIAPGNFPIMEYATYLKINHRVYMSDQLFASIFCTRDDMVWLFNAFDGLLHPSQTEGFGLTVVEAESCGVPVVVNGTHSMPELVVDGKTGSIAPTQKKRWTSGLTFWHPADVDKVYNSMEDVYQMVKENPDQVKKDCRDNVDKNFNIDTIFEERWLPLFLDLQEKLLPKLTTPIQTSKI